MDDEDEDDEDDDTQGCDGTAAEQLSRPSTLLTKYGTIGYDYGPRFRMDGAPCEVM